MDPNKLLEEIRETYRRINEGEDYVDSGDAVALAELVQCMDTWLSRGGFKPDAWK